MTETSQRPRTNSKQDALSLYLREIENIPVLDFEEEQRCAKKALRGNRAARQQLIRHNLRFVVKVAREYQRPTFPLEDLINEGNVGLVQAAERFDPARGCRFISYASWWIRRNILAYLTDRSRLVRIPADRVYDRMRLGRVEAALEQRLERQPEPEELAQWMECRVDDIVLLKGLPVVSMSLDEPSEGEDSEFELDTLEDNGRPSDEQLDAKQRAAALLGAMDGLDSRERTVLKRHYGLLGAEPESLQEIGSDWGITRERVRQLKERALSKIRRSAQDLAEYLS